jgi:MFS transporter, DHA2 family, multidrug resistance protein
MAETAALSSSAPGAEKPAGINYTVLFLGFSGMVLGQFMAFLDIQIVASSLAQIQAGVGASADEIAWVQTIYLLTEVLIMPLTAYLTRMWGTRPFFIGVCTAFIIASVLTGFTTSIESMIVMRAIQGLAAGAMIPPVFAIAFSAFPPEKRITANIVVGMIVTLAPTIGPTLGGHITETLGWRWLFFVNVPPGLLAIALVWRYGRFDKADPSLAKGIDWWGVVLMAIALLSMQYVLEEGPSESWFDDGVILWLTVTAALAGALFIWRQLAYRQPIIRLQTLKDRNFILGLVMTFITGATMFGGVFILPLVLAQVRGYSAAEVGTTMLISGLVMFFTAPTLGRVVRVLDPRLTMFVGFAICAYGVGLGHQLTKDWGFWEFAWLQALRSFGIMVAMIAAQSSAVSTMPISLMKDASAILNLIRNVGGAVGLAVLATELSTQRAIHYSDLTSRISIASAQGQGMIAGLTERFAALGVVDPGGAARKAFGYMLQREAATLAFADSFALMAVVTAIAAVLALFAAPSQIVSQEAAEGMH